MATIIVEISGQFFKRRTDRTYTHAVVFKLDYDVELSQSLSYVGLDIKRNWTFYAEKAASGDPHYASYAERIAMGKEKYAEQQKALARAKVEARRQEGAFEKFYLWGFCGRLDLAEKAARVCMNRRGNIDVTIVPVTEG